MTYAALKTEASRLYRLGHLAEARALRAEMALLLADELNVAVERLAVCK